MPSIIYTPAQQAQLDAANKAVSDAQAQLTSYKNAVTAEYNEMNTVWNDGRINKDVYKKLPQSLSDQLAFGSDMDANACHGGLIHGKEAAACRKAVGEFNFSYDKWKDYSGQAATWQSNLAAAQKALRDLNATLQQDPNVANQINANNILNAGTVSAKQKKVIFFGLATVIIIIGAIIIGSKMFGSRASA